MLIYGFGRSLACLFTVFSLSPLLKCHLQTGYLHQQTGYLLELYSEIKWPHASPHWMFNMSKQRTKCHRKPIYLSFLFFAFFFPRVAGRGGGGGGGGREGGEGREGREEVCGFVLFFGCFFFFWGKGGEVGGGVERENQWNSISCTSVTLHDHRGRKALKLQ